jgi:hypothetical protein
MQVKGGRSLSHINWVCPHALRAFFGMTLGCKKQSSRLSAPESKSLGPSSSKKASLGLAKDRHEDESGAWLIRVAPASRAGLRWPVQYTILRPHGRVRTSNTPSFPLKGCKKIVMIVTIVTR